MDKEKGNIDLLMPVNHNVDMDIARYNVTWLYIVGINNQGTIDYIRNVEKVNSKNDTPVEILIVENDIKIRAYVYIFPDKETHKRYLNECDYESTSFNILS